MLLWQLDEVPLPHSPWLIFCWKEVHVYASMCTCFHVYICIQCACECIYACIDMREYLSLYVWHRYVISFPLLHSCFFSTHIVCLPTFLLYDLVTFCPLKNKAVHRCHHERADHSAPRDGSHSVLPAVQAPAYGLPGRSKPRLEFAWWLKARLAGSLVGSGCMLGWSRVIACWLILLLYSCCWLTVSDNTTVEMYYTWQQFLTPLQ